MRIGLWGHRPGEGEPVSGAAALLDVGQPLSPSADASWLGSVFSSWGALLLAGAPADGATADADAGALAGVDGVEDELQAVRPSAEMAATASAAALILVFMKLPRLVQVICRDDSLTTCA